MTVVFNKMELPNIQQIKQSKFCVNTVIALLFCFKKNISIQSPHTLQELKIFIRAFQAPLQKLLNRLHETKLMQAFLAVMGISKT
jgi:hypothetical protein